MPVQLPGFGSSGGTSIGSAVDNAGTGISNAVRNAGTGISNAANNASLNTGGNLPALPGFPEGGSAAAELNGSGNAPAVNDVQKQIYTVSEGYVQFGDGTQLPVSGFQLSLQQNGIPRINARVVPQQGKGAPSEGNTDAISADLGIFIQLYYTLKGLLESQTNRVTKFNFQAQSVGGDKQGLALSGWILTGVGFPQISATGALDMAIEIQHPARLANESPIQMSGLRPAGFNAAGVQTGGNVLTGLQNALAQELVAVRSLSPSQQYIPASPDTVTGFRTLLQRFSDAVASFRSNFQWKPIPTAVTGYPTATAIGATNFTDRFHSILWRQAEAVESRTVWDWFSCGMISDWYLSIMPTFSQTALTVMPFAPWAPPMVNLDETNVLQFSNPPGQTLLLAGTMMNLNHPVITGSDVIADNAKALESWADQCVMHVEPNVFGTILNVATPQWWNMMLLESASETSPTSVYHSGANGDVSASNVNGDTAATQTTVDANMMLPALAKWATSICEEAFIERYQRDVRISLTCRLMITDASSSTLDGGFVLPGCVYSLKAGADGTLLRFYCTEVTHIVDCTTRQASTTISGGYVRQVSSGGSAATTGVAPSGSGSNANLIAIPSGVAYNILYGGSSGSASSSAGSSAGTPTTSGIAPSVSSTPTTSGVAS